MFIQRSTSPHGFSATNSLLHVKQKGSLSKKKNVLGQGTAGCSTAAPPFCWFWGHIHLPQVEVWNLPNPCTALWSNTLAVCLTASFAWLTWQRIWPLVNSNLWGSWLQIASLSLQSDPAQITAEEFDVLGLAAWLWNLLLNKSQCVALQVWSCVGVLRKHSRCGSCPAPSTSFESRQR